MMVRFFLVLLLLFSTNGQFIVWDSDQQVWCTDWLTLSVLPSVLTEPCNNIRYDFRPNINTGTQMERGCCFAQASQSNANKICSGWKSQTASTLLKMDVTGCTNINLTTESNNNQVRLCC